MSFLSQLNWRYATKKFNTTRKLSDTDVDKVLEAIRMTPTSFGLQPYHFYVVTDQATKDQIQQAAFHQVQVGTCSHLIVMTARTDTLSLKEEFFTLISGGDAERRKKLSKFEKIVTAFVWLKKLTCGTKNWTARQVYIALGFAHAACAELEIDSCPMEGFSARRVARILDLPRSHVPILLLPIGYRAPEETPRPKQRFPIETLVTLK